MEQRDARLKPSHTLKFRLAALLLVLLSGCDNQPITSANAGAIFDQFSGGQIRLHQGLKSVGDNIWFSDQMFEAAVKKDWPGLSKIVIQADSGDDIGYFYLGLAAQGLGYGSAARIYYGLSIDDSNSNVMPTLCTPWPGRTYLGPQCHGIQLPDFAQERLNQLPPDSSGPST